MKEEFQNIELLSSGIIPEKQEHRNTPKTIHSEATTTSGDDPPLTKRGRGAPPGNLNALKTGRHTRGARILRKKMWLFTSQIDALVRMVEAEYGFEVSFRRRHKQNWPVMS